MTDDGDQPSFEPLNIADQSAWDDSALIRAFELATKTHTLANGGHDSRQRGKRRRQDFSHEQSIAAPPNKKVSSDKDNRHYKPALAQKTPSTAPIEPCSSEPRVMVPPPPPALQGMRVPRDVERLLLAWYEAGYRAGAYAAKLSVRHDDHDGNDALVKKGSEEEGKEDGYETEI